MISWNFSLPYSNLVSGIIVDASPSSLAVKSRDGCNELFGDMNNLMAKYVCTKIGIIKYEFGIARKKKKLAYACSNTL